MYRISKLVLILNVCVLAELAPAEDKYVSPQGHEARAVMQQTLGSVFMSAQKQDFAGFLSAAAERYIQHSPDLPDGWKPVWDLLAKRPEGFSSTQMKWLGPGGFLDNGQYMIMLREVNRGDGTPPSKIVDIMRFDRAGKYAEHWDIRQGLAERTASGRSETEAAEEFLNNPVNYPPEIEEANKRTVASFLDLAFNQQKVGEALDTYVSANYVQHSPAFADGTQAIRALADAGKMPSLKHDIQLIAAQNDLVVVFSKVTNNSNTLAMVDIHRVRNGKLVEHWDVIQLVPSPAEMPHTNGMFMRSAADLSGSEVGAIELISYKPKQGVSVEQALALDRRIKLEFVVKQPGYLGRHTGVTQNGTIYIQVLWDSIKSVEASQAKGMQNELMGSYMQLMDQATISFANISVKQ